MMYAVFVLSLIAAIISPASGAGTCNTVGKSVTAEGFLMDKFCIDRGVLFDNETAITLQNPEVHTIHCLVDIQSCVDSGYVILAPPASSGGKYSVKYELGAEGSALAKTAAEDARKAGQKRGLMLKVAGIDDNTTVLKCVSVSQSASYISTTPGSAAADTRTPLMSTIVLTVMAALLSY
eukprot:TRINITY_DN20885_c0_g1_i1.p1 TRINITY_DN20885_c0_g1~~TRINITY_DN20885_c0_g1_i1.p1  ORF type:complete len:179 (+),score=28.26 TRINITY_DN20885_c0_g1_i1:110-646(+)